MAKIIDTNIEEKRINLSIRDVMPFDPVVVEGEEQDKEATPRTDRKPRRKDRFERKGKSKDADGVNTLNEKSDAANDSRFSSSDSSTSATTIGDILASKLQDIPEMEKDTIEKE